MLLLFLAVFTFAWNSRGRSLYLRWQRDQQLLKAEMALQSKDYQEAARIAREVGAVDTRSLRAARIAAESLDQLGLPDSVPWRRRVAELTRNDPDSLTAWAYAAFSHDDLRSAYAALRFFPRGTDTAAYHDIAGRVALSRNDRTQARLHFSRALEKNPNDEALKTRFAEAHIDSPVKAERERAVALLEAAANQSGSPTALNALTREALDRGDAQRARRFSDLLLSRTNLNWADRLVHLSVLRKGNAPEYPAERDRLQAEAAESPERLVRWLDWSAAEGLAPEILQWFAKLPPSQQNYASVMSAASDLYVSAGDWNGLKDWVYNANWADLEIERMAFQALAQSHLLLGGPTAVEGLWSNALREAKGQPQHLHWLADRAERWQLSRPAEITLWLMIQKDIDADGALERLASLYRRLNQTEGLLKVAKRGLEMHPGDPAFESEVLYYSALLRIEPLELERLAVRVVPRVTNSPDSATAVAMFMARANKAEQGLELLQRLPEAELAQPARRALLTLLLAQVSDRARARTELERADRTGLLPEEGQMLEEARTLARAF